MSNNAGMITEMLRSMDTQEHSAGTEDDGLIISLLNSMERSSTRVDFCLVLVAEKSRLRNTTYMNHSTRMLKGKVGLG